MYGWPFMWGRRAAACGVSAGCGTSAAAPGPENTWYSEMDDLGSGSFGVRRPLRFMAHKLQLSESQVAQLAAILNDIKTERAQAAVDDRKVVNEFASLFAAEKFDEARAKEIAAERVRIAERLRDAVVRTLSRTHAMLEPGQRERLAYLLRTGALTI
ncbi:MAG: periplasmic heavy metal sensor [Myxococcota bacterium]